MQVSRICLGMMSYGSTASREWFLPEDQARPFVKRALELGINFFDTADVYSLGVSEEITGRALRDFARRDPVIIATHSDRLLDMLEDPVGSIVVCELEGSPPATVLRRLDKTRLDAWLGDYRGVGDLRSQGLLREVLGEPIVPGPALGALEP